MHILSECDLQHGQLRSKLKAESSEPCEESTADFIDETAVVEYEKVSFSFGARPDRTRYLSVGERSEPVPYLFNVSLYENITMFGFIPGKDSKEYQELLNSLNLTELAKRVGNEPLSNFGDKISGGERQRISIARSMRHHPAIMIFDEPTTGLDPENARLINEFIFSQTDMTRIVITYDWSEDYLKRFDQVITIGRNEKS